MSTAIVLDANTIIYFNRHEYDLLRNLIDYIGVRVVSPALPTLVPMAEVFIPEAVELELLMISGWEFV
ncbi:hypothetical protein [Vulcanisaeta distributa]|uniref:hypothetical protein n=1 Tax=Vulcanisaeta distributa TaxID=164451 RepID=UPI0006CF83F8|nr:hypothetical protein [Vulcanisaeta distributa]